MTTSPKEEQLRSALIDILSQDEVDSDALLALSDALTKADPNAVRFSVDASLISRLGRELVARQETAVAELVKNAYDADARQVTLVFSEAEAPGGRLELIDDGLGMSRDQLVSGFMRLASSEKVDAPISPRYARQRAGRKGIGRFAVQRLGDTLTITTQTKESPIALRVTVDWNKFAAGQDLSTIPSRITQMPKQKEEGTTLLISGLREAWNEASIRKVYKYVSDLIQPFPLSEKSQSSRTDPGFKIDLLREVEGKFELVADEATEIFQHALAEIEGYVDSKGRGYWSIRSDKLEFVEQDIPIGQSHNSQAPFNQLRNVQFKVYYFIYEANLIPRSQLKTIRELASEKGGIRVYRNGFRVAPYGEAEDDWLGLDALARRRTFLPAIANNNFFGFVEIVDIEGERFEETSSREGLLNNRAFEELQDFLLLTLKAATTRVAEARNKKVTASQKNAYKDDPGVTITKAYKSLDKTAKELVKAGQPEQAKYIKTVSKQLQVASKAQNEQSGAVLEELAMLRVLASLGITIGEFTHEVRQSLIPAATDANWLAEQLQEGSAEQGAAARLRQNIQGFKTYASYFDEAISDNASRELLVQDVQLVVQKFVSVIKSAAERANIKVHTDLAHDLFTRPMHASEWASILFNFFTNSRKAISRAASTGKILIRAGRKENKIFVSFADNGDGVAPNDEERIFNAFFTTSSPADRRASEIEEVQGTGLGLKIVRDIAESYSGEVRLVAPPEGYSTCFKVEFPAASEAELEAYDA